MMADRSPRVLCCLAALMAFAALGCSTSRIETIYGRRTGPRAITSLNGTSVLAEMFKNAGHKVRSWGRLSPALHEADVIVWFPDRFEPPKQETIDWLEDWSSDPNKTLIYVGRDYDAEPDYWQAILPNAPAETAVKIKEHLTEASTRVAMERASMAASVESDWFTIDGKSQPRQVHTLDGPWSEGIDPKKVEIKLAGRPVPPEWNEVLLESEGDVLVSREADSGAAPLIVVANGSFLVNFGLVHHENRKLAMKLIEEIGPPSQSVFFLESGSGDPPILEKEPAAETPTGMEAFAVWPLNVILLHLAILGALFMLARWPIFGLPRSLDRRSTSDFGAHVKALGALLQRTGDREFAVHRVRHYQQVAGIDPGSHPSNPNA